MFKVNKEKDNNYISTEEAEKIYEFQKKAFDVQIAEQNKKIEELVDYISARFGEDIANSNIATKIKNLEENLHEIQSNYKANLEKTTKTIKNEIEKETKKIATDLNDAQTEAYFKLLQKNESDLEELKNIFTENKEDEKINILDKNLQKHIEDEEEYRNKIDKELKSTNQKISKINYLGITSKFDKKIKEECIKLDEKIGEVKNKAEENTAKLNKQFLDKLEQVGQNFQTNGEEILKLQTMFVTEKEKTTKNIENNANRIVALDEKLTDEIDVTNGNIQTTKNELEGTISKEIEKVNENIQTAKNGLDAKFINEIDATKENIQTTKKELEGTISKEIGKVNENIQNTKNDLDGKIIKEIENINKTIDSSINSVNCLKEELVKEMEKTDAKAQCNEMAIVALEANVAKQIEQTRDAIKKLNDVLKTKNTKLEEKLKLVDKNLTVAQEKIKKDTLLETDKIKEELHEQISNNYNENKTELQNISGTIEIIRNSMDVSMDNIGQEISKLKEEVKTSLENQDNQDIELLKKDYNKHVTKVNNELAKISKDLLNAQKKNLEQNRDLQVKIKAYIDAKIEKINNTEKIEELINNLNLSILEREKLQKIEMEELLNKKLKEIQKENERILNKKIEEISSKMIRENSTNIKVNPNKVTFYEEAPKNKKNMYELIDEDQILKRSAASKDPLSTTKEGKSQILKFFYDNDD